MDVPYRDGTQIDRSVTPQLGYFVPVDTCSCLQIPNIRIQNSPSQWRRSSSRCGSISPSLHSRRCSVSPIPLLNQTIEHYSTPVIENIMGAGNMTGGTSSWNEWETHHVNVSRVPGYGFGIAVSGGRDNPHFASGDPSIAVSDVLKAGPAQDLLQVNDRIVSVNGISLENVEYATAVQVLRDSGNTVSLIVKRRAASSMSLSQPTTLKITLTKGKKEDFGIVLGCKLFIKEISSKTRDQLNAVGQSLNEGDVITKLNNSSCSDSMSLKEAKKIIDGCKEKLSLVVLRETRNLQNPSNFSDQNYNNNYGADVQNSYSGQNLYVAPPSRSTLIGDNVGTANNHVLGNGNNVINSGRARGPLPVSPESSTLHQHNHPPRPPPPRPEDYYTSRRQLYDEDPLSQRTKPTSEPRLISFQKDGSVGLRLTGGNQVGIFVSAVQPGSPASLQGLCPGDNILKINDMDMKGVTREEAVLFLLSLQDQIDLIVQHSPDEYQTISAQSRGDSFHIKCHFHYIEATKGEMTFRSGDVFHVIDTLHNGTVGAWQVFRIGRNNQEVQKGIIPNKARAEELATAQFNANKKELTQGASESRGNFFRRRRSTHRRSKSLGKEHWDDVVFSDSISKFPAYERVILKHPGFVRPIILFGPIADLARERLIRDYPEKFVSPQSDNSIEDGKSKNISGIIRLSGIRAIMEKGKHALLDITPNAVDRLNYAQFYPIVIFLKADNKHIIKQLRQGIPKSAHKSSKKLLEYSQRMERVWGHIFTQTISLNDATINSWFSKLTELIQRCQAQQLWISETKRSEPLSDDFLFPMCSTNESRLSYASSPESDAEAGGTETRGGPRLLRASSDPSVATTQDNLDRDNLTLTDMVPPPPPYTSGYGDSKYGFSSNTNPNSKGQGISLHEPIANASEADGSLFNQPLPHSPPQSPHGIYGHVPDLPPRIDRGVKPPGGVLLPGPTPGRNPNSLRQTNQANIRPSAQERLFGTPRNNEGDSAVNPPSNMHDRHSNNGQSSLDRHRHLNNTNSYDSMSSYDSYAPNGLAPNSLALANARLGPNAPDDLKVGPRSDNQKYDIPPANTLQKRLSGGGSTTDVGSGTNIYHSRDINGSSINGSNVYGSRDGNGLGTYSGRDMNSPQRVLPTQSRQQLMNMDYNNKYNNRNNITTSEYMGSIGKAAGANGPPSLYKPVPPPKPKHYRPPINENQPPQPHHAKSYSVGNGGTELVNSRVTYNQQSNQNLNMTGNSPGINPPTNGYNYSGPGRGGPWGGNVAHSHSHSHSGPGSSSYLLSHTHQQNTYSGNIPQTPPYTGPPPHLRSPPQTNSPHVIDLAGSREQRGSAFELYRKPQHLHNISSTENSHDNPENGKANKKLSKKSSFFKNLSFDIFRSKTSKKVSKHHSLCEYDLRKEYQCFDQNVDNSASMSNSDYGILSKNTRKLLRSNSSCEKRPLKPILKRQSSFCENRSNTNLIECPQNVTNTRRRQNSMCEIETEPKIKPLRRQNSMIEYRRTDDYRTYSKNFNMITKIDPLYQRMIDVKDSQKCYDNPRSYNMIPVNSECKPESMREKLLLRQTQYPYSSRKDVIKEQNFILNHDPRQYLENPYNIKSEGDYACCRQMNDNLSPDMLHRTESPAYKQNPYATKEELLRGRSLRENHYSTKEEILSDRFNLRILSSEQNNDNYRSKDELKKVPPFENPYQTKQELLLHRIYSNNSIYESLRNKKSNDETKYSTDVHKTINSMTEDLQKTLENEHHMDKFHDSNSAENVSENNSTLVPECICEDISTSIHQPCSKYGNPVESMYVSRQEILSQKAAMNKDLKCLSPNSSDKLEMIKLRNLAKKEKIYQTKLECNSNVLSPSEPIYVSKRISRDPVIYESQESKDVNNLTPNKKAFDQDGPYDLSDNAHLSRRGSLYQSKQEALSESAQPSIDFNTLRNSCDTNSETPTNNYPYQTNTGLNANNHLSEAKICNSETSINTNCESLCSMQFLNKPQSTPYTSQDFNGTETIPLFKCNNRKVTDQNVPNPPNSFQLDMSVLAVGQKGKIDSGAGSCTTWGIFDNEGGTLEDRVWGVSLEIPPDAILSGVKQKIYFTVTDPRLSNSVGGPPIDMDKGEALLSPLVMCGPQGLGFARPVTLRLPHCANTLPSLGLTLNATDTEPAPSWDNILLPATTTLNTVAVKVDHF